MGIVSERQKIYSEDKKNLFSKMVQDYENTLADICLVM